MKMISGRFVFLIATAGVFTFMSIKGTLPSDKITEIIMIVVIAYFGRSDRTTGGETK